MMKEIVSSNNTAIDSTNRSDNDRRTCVVKANRPEVNSKYWWSRRSSWYGKVVLNDAYV